MSQPWHDLAEKTLGPDDTVERTYSCSFDNQYGYLCLGRKKMVFVNVKGFLKKNYYVLFDAPYNEINEVGLASRFKFNLVRRDKTHQLETSEVSAKVVVNGIEDVVKASPSSSSIVFKGL
jgi:hypothetical protein